MSKILFPTDFSDLSISAFKYALEYAHTTGSSLIVFHAYVQDEELPVSELFDTNDILFFRDNQDTFIPFENIRKEYGYEDVLVDYVVEMGDFLSSLEEYIAEHGQDVDIIFMGTHRSKFALSHLFMEHNSVKIMERIKIPVIAIPEEASFVGKLDKIAFLVDYQEEDKEAILDFLKHTYLRDVQLHIVHFDLSHTEPFTHNMEKFKDELALPADMDVYYVTVDSLDIKEALDKYVESEKIDMVCLINHHSNSYQRLFTYNLSEDLIRNKRIPVMAIYKS